MTLLDLAERCEKATGPSSALDLEIYKVSGKRKPFTSSLDAAMTLVPEDAWWSVMRAPCADGYDAEVANDDHRRAATPALALCAAALRAQGASA